MAAATIGRNGHTIDMSHPIRRRRLIVAATCMPFLTGAAANSWPATTRLVVPSLPGGAVDLVARSFGPALGALLDTSVIVENRPGASGLLAAKAVAMAPADGSTLLYLHSGHVTLQATGAHVLDELTPVSKLHVTPHMLAVSGDAPYRSFSDLLGAIRSRAHALAYASGGQGSPSHLVVERLLGHWPDMPRPLHVPFKTPGEAVAAVAAHHVDFGFAFPGTIEAHGVRGRLRALAVASMTRLAAFPQVETFAEGAVPGFRDEPWGGIAMPAGAPEPLVARLATAIGAVTGDARFQSLLARIGSSVAEATTPRAFAAQLRTDLAAEQQLVVRLGLRTQ